MAESDNNDTEKSPQSRGAPLTIITDLPQTLPILPEEIALVRGYLSELVARIAANDNEDQP